MDSNELRNLIRQSVPVQTIFWSILQDLPTDFPEKYKATIREMHDALRFIHNHINVEDARIFRRHIAGNLIIDDKSTGFWEAINFVWLMAKNTSISQPKLAGLKSGIKRRERQITILEELVEPLHYACEKLKANSFPENKEKKRNDADQKMQILGETVEKYDATIAEVSKKYTKWKNKEQFFEYYLNQFLKRLASLPREMNPYPDLVKRRKPRDAKSKARSRAGALRYHKK